MHQSFNYILCFTNFNIQERLILYLNTKYNVLLVGLLLDTTGNKGHNFVMRSTPRKTVGRHPHPHLFYEETFIYYLQSLLMTWQIKCNICKWSISISCGYWPKTMSVPHKLYWPVNSLSTMQGEKQEKEKKKTYTWSLFVG